MHRSGWAFKSTEASTNMKEDSCGNVNWDLLRTVILIIAYIQLHKQIAKAICNWNANERAQPCGFSYNERPTR